MDNTEVIIKRTHEVKGFFSGPQMKILFPIVKSLMPNSLLVEIGTYHGKSTRFFSLTNPEVKILTIDLVSFPERPNREGVEINPEVLRKGNILQVLGDASDIVNGFNWKIDLLFIDGCHDYEYVKRDIENWTPFILTKGYVVFHDYESTHKGVLRAVDEWMERNHSFKKVYKGEGLFVAQKN